MIAVAPEAHAVESEIGEPLVPNVSNSFGFGGQNSSLILTAEPK